MKNQFVLTQQEFDDLERRIGSGHLGARLRKQRSHSAKTSSGSVNLFWEDSNLLPVALNIFLNVFCLKKRAVRNATDYRVEKIDVVLKNLPASFHGFRILQLSDLHIGSMADKWDKFQSIIRNLDFDLCVITGDFRYNTYGGFNDTIELVNSLAASIQCKDGIFGILGNHDVVEMTPGLETAGIKMLLNESVSVKRGEDVIWIAGVDDPHFYHTHDLSKSLRSVPGTDATVVLLAHSSEIMENAYLAGVDYYLCGHTHGGQVCLPGGIALITNSRCKRKYNSGAWNYMGMPGYTSRGAGTSCLPVRLFCPPEITLHCLYCY